MSEIALAEKSKCLAIVGLAAKKNIEVRTLEDLNRTDVRNFVIDSCDILLSETIDVMKGRLSDAAIGIGAVDIPNFIADDTTLNKVWGAAIAFGIYNNIFSPSVSGVTGLPYSLYRASNAAVEQMKRNNIKLSTPDTILKFHTDGLTAKDDIGVPKFIALYNIIINYQQPGRFHWVPFVKWKEFDKFAREVGIDVPYRIALTPAVITMPDGEEVVVNNRIIEVPIFFQSELPRPIMFFNGDVLGPAVGNPIDDTVIARMLRSISEQSERISIPQKTRRLIVVNNQLGLHARDILQDPIAGSKITRSYIRSLSSEAVSVLKSPAYV